MKTLFLKLPYGSRSHGEAAKMNWAIDKIVIFYIIDNGHLKNFGF